MATRVTVVATDRLGKRLGSRVVIGPTFSLTRKDRERAYAELKTEHRESDGTEPYIFTTTDSNA